MANHGGMGPVAELRAVLERSLTFGSACSGMEAASLAWLPLGWQCAFVSEIDKAPCALLAQRFPDVPNFGDMNKFKEWPDAAIDVLVGGTPCQSFSIAGLRKGLADPRGNLSLTFLAILDRYKPEWFVWENVPGVLSDDEAIVAMLDGFEALGYVVDVDILDAQFFGLAQRRRRVFVCGQHVSHLVQRQTDSSALTIAQCLAETLHGILVARSPGFVSAPDVSASAVISADGLRRRMTLFALDGEVANWPILRENLIAAYRRSLREPSRSDAIHGAREKERTLDGRSTGSATGDQFTLTGQRLKESLDDAFAAMRWFTTSTATNRVTPSQIFTCSRAALIIGRLIALLKPSCPPWWSAASSASTALKGFMFYARQAGNDLFGGLDGLPAWRDFVREAEQAMLALDNTRVESFERLLPLTESLRGDSPPRRRAGQDLAGGIDASAGGSDENDAEQSRLVAHTLNSHGGAGGRIDAESETFVTHSLRADGFDAGEDGTGRGTPIIAIQERAVCENPDAGPQGKGFQEGVAYTLEARNKVQAVAFSCKDHGADAGELAPTLRAMGHTDSHANAGGQLAVAFALRGREGGASGGGSSRDYVADYAVRRLTPTECERLQGAQDGHTAIMLRGKPIADGPRYKMIGNSMAVPVMRWIGERIDAVRRAFPAESPAPAPPAGIEPAVFPPASGE